MLDAYFPFFSLNNSYKPDSFNQKYGNITRIQKITLNNFKGVKHGEIEFNNLKNLGESLQSSNILGIYGQNGSGKTTLIEALYILKRLMTGRLLPDMSNEYISTNAQQASMEVVFERMNISQKIVDFLTYSFSLRRRPEEELNEHPDYSSVVVFNEIITSSTRDLNGKLVKKTHKLYDSNSSDWHMNPFYSEEYWVRSGVYDVDDEEEFEKGLINEDNFLGSSSDYREEQRKSVDHGGSALFFEGYPPEATSSGIDCNGNSYDLDDNVPENKVWDELEYLHDFAEENLFVCGANLFNIFSDGESPIYMQGGFVVSRINAPSSLWKDSAKTLERNVARISTVLDSIIPGLHLVVEMSDVPVLDSDSPNEREEKEYSYAVEFFTERNGVRIPLKNESEGIKRIICFIDLLIAAYNNPNITVAIDEYDAGIFEYLLGEILQIFESSGRGQFIFTSHNLRPLEVISRKFICFTTTNPENRYIRLKYIGKTNNLRDVYFRQILVGEQDEEIYNATKRYKLVAAFEKAGDF